MNLRQRVITTFKQNLYPALLLQLIAIGLWVDYQFYGNFKDQLERLGELKSEYGLVYSALATSLFGALLPTLFAKLLNKGQQLVWRNLVFLMAVWAILGVFVDYLYQYQSVWFGNGTDWLTIAKKTAVDQFVASALLSCPFITVCYLLHDNHLDLKRTKAQLGRELLTLHIPATIITNWLIWIPAVAVVYAMPQPLQLPFFNIVLCFFALVIASLNRKK